MSGVNLLIAVSLVFPAMGPRPSQDPSPTTETVASRSRTRADWPTLVAPASALLPNAGHISHFAIQIRSAMPPEEMEVLRETLEQTYVVFYETMGKAGFDLEPVPERLVWLVFTNRQEYDRHTWQAEGVELPDLDSYYSPRTNRVAILFWKPSGGEEQTGQGPAAQVATGGAVLFRPQNGWVGEPPAASPEREAHEAAHQLAFNSGMQKRGVMYPFWVAEGLATGFESRSPLGPEAINLMRCRHLLSARRRGSLEPFAEFLVRVQVGLEETPRVQETYGQAWGVFHYLFTRHPTKLRRYLRQLAGTAPGRQPLDIRRQQVVSAMGPLDELEAGWEAYLNTLDDSENRLPAPLNGPGRRPEAGAHTARRLRPGFPQ